MSKSTWFPRGPRDIQICALFCASLLLASCGDSASKSTVNLSDVSDVDDTSGDSDLDNPNDMVADADLSTDIDADDQFDLDDGSDQSDASDLDAGDTTDVVDSCGGCLEGETCVENDAISPTCIAKDCADEPCSEGSVCQDNKCVSESCAGVACGDFPNVCREGVCEVGTCDDPDLECPATQTCYMGNCRSFCDTIDDCEGGLTCNGGICDLCTNDAQCQFGQVCDAAGVCRDSCASDPNICQADEYCDDAKTCQPNCANDTECPTDKICDEQSNACVDPECALDTDCVQLGDICLAGRCEAPSPRYVGGFTAGALNATNGGYSGYFTLGTAGIAGETSSTSNYRLYSGTFSGFVTQ